MVVSGVSLKQNRTPGCSALTVLPIRGWQLHQPTPGRYTWTSKLGYQYEVTPAGTSRAK